MLCPKTDTYEQWLFIIVNNEVLEVNSYKQNCSALFGVHYMVKLEYPKKKLTCLH